MVNFVTSKKSTRADFWMICLMCSTSTQLSGACGVALGSCETCLCHTRHKLPPGVKAFEGLIGESSFCWQLNAISLNMCQSLASLISSDVKMFSRAVSDGRQSPMSHVLILQFNAQSSVCFISYAHVIALNFLH